MCKFFIQAIETEKYGWFWECPNGENCHYRHALPPGFVLKSQKKAIEDAEKANTISLEEFLEVEVRSSPHSPARPWKSNPLPKAPQTGYQSYACHAGDIREVEADADGQEIRRGGSAQEGEGRQTRCWKEQRYERKGSCASSSLSISFRSSPPLLPIARSSLIPILRSNRLT